MKPGDKVVFAAEGIGGQFTVTRIEAGKWLNTHCFGLPVDVDLICVKRVLPRQGTLAAGYAE
jgi:hypothetical protein